MKTFMIKVAISIDANNKKIAENIVKNKLVSGKGINEISVESIKEIK